MGLLSSPDSQQERVTLLELDLKLPHLLRSDHLGLFVSLHLVQEKAKAPTESFHFFNCRPLFFIQFSRPPTPGSRSSDASQNQAPAEAERSPELTRAQ